MAKQASGKAVAQVTADPSGVRDSHIDTAKTERLRALMTQLANSGDGGNAKALVEAARDPTNNCVDCFEWDDSKAGARWRLHQATHYWGAIRVDIQMPDGPVRVPGFIPITVGETSSYRPIEEVLGRQDWREQMMAQATRELTSWQKRYDALATVASMKPVFKAIERATKKKGGKAA